MFVHDIIEVIKRCISSYDISWDSYAVKQDHFFMKFSLGCLSKNTALKDNLLACARSDFAEAMAYASYKP